MNARVLLIVRRRADAKAVFPGGVPAWVDVHTVGGAGGASKLDGLRSEVVLLGSGIDQRARDSAARIAMSVGGAVARVVE
jgi:hypothetical protein